MNNTKQLIIAWDLYASDYNEAFVNNHGDEEIRISRDSWINNLLDWEASPDNTNLVFLADSKLASYLGKAIAPYKCPADKVPSANGQRTRSMSMNGMVGEPGRLADKFNPDYVQIRRSSDMVIPANLFVFLDEHPDSINDGYFHNDLDTYRWSDLPASYHSGAASFSFADGHSEIHHWVASETKRPVRRERAGIPFAATASIDFEWMKQRASVKK